MERLADFSKRPKTLNRPTRSKSRLSRTDKHELVRQHRSLNMRTYQRTERVAVWILGFSRFSCRVPDNSVCQDLEGSAADVAC